MTDLPEPEKPEFTKLANCVAHDIFVGNHRDIGPWYKRWLTYVFPNARWLRRWIGGKWERWWVDVVHCYTWYAVRDWSPPRPSPVCRGTVEAKEDHG